MSQQRVQIEPQITVVAGGVREMAAMSGDEV
jgi:hypothetical protein